MHTQSSCPVGWHIGKAPHLTQAHCTEGSHTHKHTRRVNLTFSWCVKSYLMYTSQGQSTRAGTGGHLRFAKPTVHMLLILFMCSGNTEAPQEQSKCKLACTTTCTGMPGKFLLNTMSTLKKQMAYSAKGYPRRPSCKSQFGFVSVSCIFTNALFEDCSKTSLLSCLKPFSN